MKKNFVCLVKGHDISFDWSDEKYRCAACGAWAEHYEFKGTDFIRDREADLHYPINISMTPWPSR